MSMIVYSLSFYSETHCASICEGLREKGGCWDNPEATKSAMIIGVWLVPGTRFVFQMLALADGYCSCRNFPRQIICL